MTLSQAGAVLAVLAALGYTMGSLFLKSALSRGATSGQVNCAVNLAIALVLQPLWLFESPAIPNAPLWQPVLCCVLFFAGQICTFSALSHGDVSVATPLLGAKVVLITLINATFFGVPVSIKLWVAAAICSAAVALIASGPRLGRKRAIGITVLLSLSAATFYSIGDVLIQHWASATDEMAYLPAMFGGVGLLSCAYYLIRDRSAFLPRRPTLVPLLTGAGFLGAQVMMFFLSIVWSRDATLANILYSTRSVWSVSAAWAGGWMFGLRDHEAGPAVMIRRLIGSLLLFAAIVLILL